MSTLSSLRSNLAGERVQVSATASSLPVSTDAAASSFKQQRNFKEDTSYTQQKPSNNTAYSHGKPRIITHRSTFVIVPSPTPGETAKTTSTPTTDPHKSIVADEQKATTANLTPRKSELITGSSPKPVSLAEKKNKNTKKQAKHGLTGKDHLSAENLNVTSDSSKENKSIHPKPSHTAKGSPRVQEDGRGTMEPSTKGIFHADRSGTKPRYNTGEFIEETHG